MAIHKRGSHTANKHLTGYAPASVIRELQIRTVIYHVVPSSLHLCIRLEKIIRSENVKCWQECGKRQLATVYISAAIPDNNLAELMVYKPQKGSDGGAGGGEEQEWNREMKEEEPVK